MSSLKTGLSQHTETKKTITYNEAVEYLHIHQNNIYYYDGGKRIYISIDINNLPSQNNITTEYCIQSFVGEMMSSGEPSNKEEKEEWETHKKYIRILRNQALNNMNKEPYVTIPGYPEEIMKTIKPTPNNNISQTETQPEIINTLQTSARIIGKTTIKPHNNQQSAIGLLNIKEQEQWNFYIKKIQQGEKQDSEIVKELLSFIDNIIQKHLGSEYEMFCTIFYNKQTNYLSLQKIKAGIQGPLTTEGKLRKNINKQLLGK